MDATPAAAPAAPPQWSPDGQFWWTGRDWIPASSLPAAPSTANFSGPPSVPSQPSAVHEPASEPERVIAEGRLHAFAFFQWCWLAAAGTAGVVLSAAAGHASPAALLVILCVGAAFVALAYGCGAQSRAQTRIQLTNRRILVSVGLVQRRSFEMLLTQVESLAVKRGLLGGIFGFGSLAIIGTGGSAETLHGLLRCDDLKSRVQAAVHEAQSRRAGSH